MAEKKNTEDSSSGTVGNGKAERIGKRTALTPAAVQTLLKKPSLKPWHVGRLLFYYLADVVNRVPNPLMDSSDLNRVFSKRIDGKLEENLAFQNQVRFYEAALDMFNNERTCLQRQAFMDARRALLTPLCLQAMGGDAAMLDCALILDAAREGYAFISTGDRDKIRDILTDADFADRKDNRQPFNPFQLVQCYISEFYAQAAVLDVAADIYGAPELRTFYHPFAIVPKCVATVDLYNALREEFYKRNPQADLALYPEMDWRELRPNASKIAAVRLEAKKLGRLPNISIPLNKIQGLKIWNYTNPIN